MAGKEWSMTFGWRRDGEGDVVPVIEECNGNVVVGRKVEEP